jgi:hypothetical protein
VCSVNRQQNARAARDAAALDRRMRRAIRRQELSRPEPPLPRQPRLPAFARTSRWSASEWHGPGAELRMIERMTKEAT